MVVDAAVFEQNHRTGNKYYEKINSFQKNGRRDARLVRTTWTNNKLPILSEVIDKNMWKCQRWVREQCTNEVVDTLQHIFA